MIMMTLLFIRSSPFAARTLSVRRGEREPRDAATSSKRTAAYANLRIAGRHASREARRSSSPSVGARRQVARAQA
jgi:hypothetical protein